MKLIQRIRGNESPTYYKFTQGQPVFGAKKNDIRLTDKLAEIVLRQLEGMGVQGCSIIEDFEG